jgi:hypothetical protein
MRGLVDRAKLEEFMAVVGARATTPGTVYLVGGATALLLGIREQTIDVDLKLAPEPGGIFQAIAELKQSLNVNVELASPDHFLPPLPGWADRSLFIASIGAVVFRHYDFYSQALAKIERGHDQDLSDARALLKICKLSDAELVRLAKEIEPDLIRYPSIDAEDFFRKLADFLAELSRNQQP